MNLLIFFYPAILIGHKTMLSILVYNNKSIYRNKNLIKVFSPSDQYENQVNDFSKKIIKKNKFIHNLEDAKKNMRVIDSIFLSNKFRKWTKV